MIHPSGLAESSNNSSTFLTELHPHQLDHCIVLELHHDPMH